MNGLNVPSQPCPNCGVMNDSATSLGDEMEEPAVGDFTVCVHCKNLLRFGYGLVVERLGPGDVEDLANALAQLVKQLTCESPHQTQPSPEDQSEPG
jgi:hypothetical protein